MTASKNPENINVQLLSLAIVLSTYSAMAESLNRCYAPISCFHQGPEGRQTPGELKKCEFTLSNSPPKGEKL